MFTKMVEVSQFRSKIFQIDDIKSRAVDSELRYDLNESPTAPMGRGGFAVVRVTLVCETSYLRDFVSIACGIALILLTRRSEWNEG